MFSSISETALNIAVNKRNASATGQHSQLFSLSISLPLLRSSIYQLILKCHRLVRKAKSGFAKAGDDSLINQHVFVYYLSHQLKVLDKPLTSS